MNTNHRIVIVVAALSLGCVVQGGKDVPPVKAANGSPITVNAETQEVGLDGAKVPQVASCGDGQFVKRTSTGWECAVVGAGGVDGSVTPIVPGCATGHVVRKTAAGWECVAMPEGGSVTGDAATGVVVTAGEVALDTSKVPVVGACADGQVVAKTPSGWECRADATGVTVGELNSAVAGLRPTAACGAEEVSRWTGSGWECVAAGETQLEVWGPQLLDGAECVDIPAVGGKALVAEAVLSRQEFGDRWEYLDSAGSRSTPSPDIGVTSSDVTITTSAGTIVPTPGNALDGYWNAPVGSDLSIDLGAVFDVSSLQVTSACGPGGRATRLQVDASVSGSNFAGLTWSCPCNITNCVFETPRGLRAKVIRLKPLEGRDCANNSQVSSTGICLKVKRATVLHVVSTQANGTLRVCNAASTLLRAEFKVIGRRVAWP